MPTLALAAAATTTGTDAAGAGGSLGLILMMVVMVAIFYFMMIRPENKRKKEMAAMRESLQVGDQITSIGGIVGTICAVKENTIVIETGADRVRLEMTKWAVSSKGTQEAEDTTTAVEKSDK